MSNANVVNTFLYTTSEQADGGWVVADSFSFGVEREMKESGEKMNDDDLWLDSFAADEASAGIAGGVSRDEWSSSLGSIDVHMTVFEGLGDLV
jgi:hypothetical protein